MSTFFKSVVNFGSSILFGHADVENSRREEDHHRAKLDSHTQASMQHLSTAKSPFKIQKCSFTHTTIRDHDVDYQHRSKPQAHQKDKYANRFQTPYRSSSNVSSISATNNDRNNHSHMNGYGQFTPTTRTIIATPYSSSSSSRSSIPSSLDSAHPSPNTHNFIRTNGSMQGGGANIYTPNNMNGHARHNRLARNIPSSSSSSPSPIQQYQQPRSHSKMFETPLSSSMSSSNTSSARSSSSSSKRNTHFTPKNTPVPRTHKHGHSHGHNHNHNLNHSHSHNLSHVDSPFSAPALDGGSARNTPAFSHSGSVQNRVSVSTFSAERKRLGAQSFRHRIRMNRRHRHSSGRGIYTTATDKAGTPSIVSHPHTFTDKQTKSAVYSVPSSTDASSRFTNDATLREIRDWNLDAPLPTSSSTSSSSSTLAPFASAQATSSSSSSVFKKPASPSVASPSYSFSASHVSFPQSLSSASPSSSQSPSQSLSSSPTLSPSSVARELSPSTLTRRLQAQSAQSAPHLQVTQCHQPQFKVPITIPAYSDLRFHSHDDEDNEEEDNEEEDNESSRLSPSSMALTTTSVSPSASLPPASAAYPGSSSSPSLTRSFSFAADSPVSHFSNVHLSHLSDVHRGVRELTQQRVGAALEQHDSSTGVVSSLEQDILLQMQSLNLHKSAREERERSMEEEIQLRILKKKIAKTMGPELLEELLEAVIWDEIGAVKKTFPLSQEEEEESEDLLYEEDNYVLIDLFNQEITTELLSCLQIGTWLNDEVMNFYMALLIQRNKRTLANQQAPAHAKLKCHFFNSFFYTKLYCKGQYKYKNVRKWSKKAKVDILQLDKVFAPIHVGNNHWCCGVINVRDKRFEYYDSLGGRNPACLKSLRKYVVDEAKQYHDLDLDVSDWQDYSPSSIPRQRNGCDCGVFTCKFIDYLSEDRPLTFRQKQMPYFRYRMALEIKLATVL